MPGCAMALMATSAYLTGGSAVSWLDASGEPNSTEIGLVSAAVQHWKNEHDWRATKYRCRDITDLLERGPHRAHPRPESKSIAASAASGIVASCCWFNERLPFRTDIFF